jgi:hypothetical protein
MNIPAAGQKRLAIAVAHLSLLNNALGILAESFFCSIGYSHTHGLQSPLIFARCAISQPNAIWLVGKRRDGAFRGEVWEGQLTRHYGLTVLPVEKSCTNSINSFAFKSETAQKVISDSDQWIRLYP